MRLLLSNDDGIDSPFLPAFAAALTGVADVEIVVPAREQSWIGRAYNRHAAVAVGEAEAGGFKCRTVAGTPSDCVNIALSHLLPEPPDAVVSGLNIGQNVALPLLWSSGTFAAAVEAAGWGIPAFACSMRLLKKFYEICRLRREPPPDELRAHLEAASEHAARYIADCVSRGGFAFGEVRNLNYPAGFSEESEFSECVPARAKLAPLYVKNPDGTYGFSYAMGETAPSPDGRPTDVECLNAGIACVSKIFINAG